MTATNHALTGAAIVSVVGNTVLALPLALLSHFACDAVPHFGFNMKFGSRSMWLYLLVELVVMAVLAPLIILYGVHQPLIWLVAGSILAMSPDLAWYYYGKNGMLKNVKNLDLVSRFHARIQWSETKPGILVEIAWATLMVGLITTRL